MYVCAARVIHGIIECHRLKNKHGQPTDKFLGVFKVNMICKILCALFEKSGFPPYFLLLIYLAKVPSPYFVLKLFNSLPMLTLGPVKNVF
jgi:hypothetical protein